MTRNIPWRLLAIVVATLGGLVTPRDACADVRLPAIFSSRMVLQRDQAVAFWGWASPGESVDVSFRGQSATATAGGDGRWIVRLRPMKASAVGSPLTVRAANAIELADVLVGEVWLASGQSNMAMTAGKTSDWAEAMKTAADPLLRLYKVTPGGASPLKPVDDCRGEWLAANVETAKKVSAVGYFFARRLREKLNVPVGVIDSAWGGSCAEHWTSQEALVSSPTTKPLWDEFEKRVAAFDPATATPKEERVRLLAAFRAKIAEAARNKSRRPKPPRIVGPPTARRFTPCNMFNTMIHPLIPFGLRGVLWYQGEGNRFRAEQYETLLPLLIADWRRQWDRPDLPFGIVQLANISKPSDEPRESEWADLQWAQFRASRTVPNTGLAVINDGQDVSLHPRDKQKVGDRLAQWAIATIYKKSDSTHCGPIYRDARVVESAVVVRFDQATGLRSSDGQPLQTFQIAGDDRKWVWAVAKINGETVVVSSPAVTRPVAVRYAWASNPARANLTNASGLPASLFKTDSWPGPTHGKLVPSAK